jgi:hypothetical protein
MKVFTIYKHESKGYEAVKIGFSWPALIFHFWWMLSKGFLFLFIFYVAVYILSMVNYDVDMNTPFNSNDFFYLIVALILFFYPGFYGNSWLHKKYKDKSYIEVKSIPASSKDTAIAIAKNDEAANLADSNLGSSIEEDSELFYEKAYSEAYEEVKDFEKYSDVAYIQNSDLWAKAFSQSDGDENKQKVIYVKLRAKEIDYKYEYELDQDYKKQRKKNDLISLAAIIFILFLAILVGSNF